MKSSSGKWVGVYHKSQYTQKELSTEFKGLEKNMRVLLEETDKVYDVGYEELETTIKVLQK